MDSGRGLVDDPRVWLFVGAGQKYEAVPDGREVQRLCNQCHRNTVFYEKKVTQRITLYFVDLFAHSPKHLMVCGACGAGYAVDSLTEEGFMDAQRGTALGVLSGAASKARAAIEEADLAEEASRIGDAVGQAADSARRSINDWVKKRINKG